MPGNRKAAFVDLGRRAVRVKEIPLQVREKYLGGRGLADYFCFIGKDGMEEPPGTGAPLVLSAGLLSGVPAPSSDRMYVAGRSPLTGRWGGVSVAGFFGPELRFAGFDAVWIQGEASSPVYLWIHDGEIEFREASWFWGAGCLETGALVREILDDEDAQVLTIGRGGERRVRFAGICTGGGAIACGRLGLGAVMGAGNLKAIAVRGSLPVHLSDPPLSLHWLGEFQGILRLGENTEKKGGGVVPEHPMVRTLMQSERFREWGLDPFETAHVLLCALELSRVGLLPSALRKELDPYMEDVEAVERWAERIVEREGVGDVLAEGRLGMFRRLEIEPAVLEEQGLSTESPCMWKRGSRGTDRERGASSTPARLSVPDPILGTLFGRDRIEEEPERKAWQAVWFEWHRALSDALGIPPAHWLPLASHPSGYDVCAALVEAVSGLHFDASRLLDVGKRICALDRLIEIREAASSGSKERKGPGPGLPGRGLRGLPGAALAWGDREREAYLRVYHEAHGWDAHGNPTADTLRRLGLEQESSQPAWGEIWRE